MDKLQELNHLIIQYGYIAIFLFVFLQEIGIPNPITNELVLLFSGYLAYTGTLSVTKVILVTVSADFIGTSILYFGFYALSKHYIFNNTPTWLLKFETRIKRLKARIDKKHTRGIFIGRLTPFLRGYVSVAAGILQIKPSIFLTTVLLSAITWSGGLVITGRLLGPCWNDLYNILGVLPLVAVIIISIFALLLAGRFLVKRELSKGLKRV